MKEFWNKSTTNKLIIIIGTLWILLAILFAFYDLNISKSIVDQNTLTGQFVESFGEIPGFLIIILSFFLVSSNINIRKKYSHYILLFGIWLINTALIYYSIGLLFLNIDAVKEILVKYSILLWFLFGLLSLFLIFLFRTKLKPISKKYLSFAKVSTSLFFISYILFIQVFKGFWGRIRFRDLLAGFSNFTPWYFPQGLTGGHSFPSGHAALSWMFLPLILLFLNKKKWKRISIISLVVFWGLFVVINRVYFGAHYASDVLFSTGFTIIVFLFLYKKYYKRELLQQ